MWERRVEARCPYADGCKVISVANTTSRIPRELLSRFLVVRVPEYTERQVADICVALLSRRGRGERYARRVAELVVGELGSRDPRDCLKLDGLARGSEEELEEVVRDLKEGLARPA